MSGQARVTSNASKRKSAHEVNDKAVAERLGRQDWIDAAWAALGRGTIEHVKVERLSHDLKVTRGSFYWHFKNRQDLMDAVLESWFKLFGLEEAIRPLEAAIDDPADKLWAIYDHVIRSINGSQTIALRLWAQRTPKIRERLRREDDARLRHYTFIFRALRFGPAEAERRGRVYYALVMSEYLRHGTRPLNERLELAREQHDLLTRS